MDTNQLWISVSELENHKYFPPMDKQLQQNLRSKNKIKYTRVGNKIFYKKEWIEDYLKSNTRDVVA